MSESDSLPDEVTVVYTESDDYHKLPANSANAQAQPSGEVKIDFVLNYYPKPETETFKIQQDGRFGEKTSQEGDQDRLINEVQGSAVLTAQNSFDLATKILSEVFSNQRGRSEFIDPEDISEVVMSQFALSNEDQRNRQTPEETIDDEADET